MLERSIRTFALDYYRNRGAKIRPVEGTEAYEIVPNVGTAMTVTFAPEPEQPDWVALTPTSPQWRAILEDLTTDVVVSYRYLVAGPIPDPASAIAPAMPEGWRVESARFSQVETRLAIAVTHRVTFDSPALNASQETIHHHLWDVETGTRLPELEARMFKLPTVLLRPTQTPDEAIVDRLLAHSLAEVDAESELSGVAIERELAELLSEAEKRANQYFDQQMGNVLNREAQLGEKLELTIKRLTEAKTPEQIARYRADGEQIAGQIAHLKARRGDELAAIEAACLSKLATEREKHELTVTTDLVALAHVTYDVVTYDVTAIAPDDLAPVAWNVRYTPVTQSLTLPACDGCGQAMVAPTRLADGRCACAGCTTACARCQTVHVAPHFAPSDCGTCRTALCAGCEVACAHCATVMCADHAGECATCEAPVCAGCARACKVCELALCSHHAQRDPVNGLDYCDRHALRGEALPEALAPKVASIVLAEPEAVMAAPAPVAAPLDPRDELCHHCTGAFRAHEMVNCGTCGVPSCVPCTQGEAAPCPACTALEPAEADDARLGFVFAEFPALARGGRRWEIAEHGPYVLTHWRRLGKGGLVVYHNGGPEPVMLSEFSYGRVEAARMAVIGWLGGR